MSDPAHVLVVAHQTAATRGLLDAVARASSAQPGDLPPRGPPQAHGIHKVIDPEDSGVDEAQRVLDAALPKLSEAAGHDVTGGIGDAEPLMAIQDAVNLGEYDEIIISTLPLGISRWLKLDLVAQGARPRAARHARGGVEQGGGHRGSVNKALKSGIGPPRRRGPCYDCTRAGSTT